jgi:hypothetical protein
VFQVTPVAIDLLASYYFQDAVDDFAAAQGEEVRPFLAQCADEHQAPAVLGKVIVTGKNRRVTIGVVNFDEKILAEMPQGQ